MIAAPLQQDEAGFTLTEREQSQLPAVALLAKMGYTYLTREEALALRGGKTGRILLEDVLRTHLQKINVIKYKGREHPFSGPNIRRAIQALDDIPLVEGTQRAGELTYDLLRLGKSLEQTVAGDTKSFSLRYIDWNTPENNVFHATTEYTLQRASSGKTCRMDIVLFVNGIPFVVIECKAPDVDIVKGIKAMIAYGKPDYVPELFKSVQLVMAIKPSETLYATAGTEEKFWALWRSRKKQDGDVDEKIQALLTTPLNDVDREAIFTDFGTEQAHFCALEQTGRTVTEQDRGLFNLCRPERLIELAGRFILYDGGIKKIARYQQYYAVKQTLKHIHDRRRGHDQRGGVIWHTQGSGKSLTMVLLANALAQDRAIENARIILVTDRVDLDKQIANTFRRCGLEPRRATSGADLKRLVEDPRMGVITTLIQKFDAALTQKPDASRMEEPVIDSSSDVFVLVDESHRTQYGPLHAKMKRVFPNGCYIGFTGTPLMKKDKSTVETFGGLIDSYTMEQAVADKAVVPLLYELRHVEQEVVKKQMDTWFEKYAVGLTPDQQKDLKKKYSATGLLMKNDQRLRTEAFDISEHYRVNWQTTGGKYKAQVVAPSKKAAVTLHRYLEQIGHVTSEVVISGMDEREGDEEETDAPDISVRKFWDEMMQKYGGEEYYNESIIERFKSSEHPEILIVVDKLITGFDVPRNTVLYLTRRLTHHTLLQAIARVNRLNEGKDFGYILDYAGILGELDRALNEYKSLSGYDPDDLDGLFDSVRREVVTLPLKRAELLNVFKSVHPKNDEEAYEVFLRDEESRDAFFKAFNAFAKSLKIALSTVFFYDETPNDVIEQYKADLRRFAKLRAAVQVRYALTVNMKALEPQILKLLDTYVTSDSAEVLTPEPFNIFDEQAMNKALEDLTATIASKADTIASATQRTITERMDQDPAFYRKFSEMLEETIRKFRDNMMSDLEYLRQARAIRDQVVSHGDEGVPARLAGNEIAQAYFRIVLEKLGELGARRNDQELAAEIGLKIDEAVRREVIVDWRKKPDVINRMRANMDEGFFDFSEQGRIYLNWEALDEIAEEAFRVARSRLQ